MKRLFAFFFALAVLSSSAFAHPGRTDSNGGHNVSGGGYHYHHGYPAHQHTNGICPYDYDDKTGRDSGGSSTPDDDPGETDTANTGTKKQKKLGVSFVIAIIFVCSVVSLLIFGFVIETIQNFKDKKLFLREQAIAMELYAGKTLEELAPVPAGTYLTANGVPKSSGGGLWGTKYTFYRSSSGCVYHKKRGCSGASIEINAVNLNGLAPCKRCNPTAPDLSWLKNRNEVIKNCKKYGITLIDSKKETPPIKNKY